MLTTKGSHLKSMRWEFGYIDQRTGAQEVGACLSSSGEKHSLSGLYMNSRHFNINQEQPAMHEIPSSVLYRFELRLSVHPKNAEEQHMLGTWDMGDSTGLVHFIKEHKA